MASHKVDVAIIGGGIVGSSIAWHLASAGQTNVIILERESSQGKGSTGKSMGGVRAQFSTPVNIRMSMYSIPFYADFESRTGHPSGYKAQGYLFCATSDEHVEYLRANCERQRTEGLKNVELMTGEAIANLYPQLRSDDIRGGSFCPTDGFIDPYSAMTGFTSWAVDHGVTLWKGAGVKGIRREGKEFLVNTERGRVSAGTVVCCAGPWAASVAAMLDVELPVKPLRRMLVPTEPFSRFPHTAPMIVDMSTGFHFRPEGRGFLLAWNDPEQVASEDEFDVRVDPQFVEKVLSRAADRVPVFEELPVDPRKAWAGLYEMTPDHHPVLGEVLEVPGFFLANGFSGHGVMHAPATGKILSDLILHGNTDLIDASLLSHARFAQGRLIHEAAIL